MVEKILAAHAGRARVVPGEYVWAKIDETNAMYDTFETSKSSALIRLGLRQGLLRE